MSARPDIRHVPGGSSGPPGGPGAAPAHSQSYYSRHPQLSARHNPANYLVDANAASKAMRNPAHAGGVPVTLTGGLTLGRSSSPAGTSRANPANYPPGGLAQRVLTNPADHAGQVRYVPFGPGASNPPFGTAGIRDVRDVYNMRGNADRHGDRGPSLVPHTSSGPTGPGGGRLTLSRHPPLAYNYGDRGHLVGQSSSYPSLTSKRVEPQTQVEQHQPTTQYLTTSMHNWMSPHNQLFDQSRFSAKRQQSSESYLREMAAAAHLQLAASGTAFAGGSTSGATISPANAAAAMAAASAVTAEAAHGSHKRPRMDLTSTHPSSASNTAAASSGSTTGSNAISHPLTIDTREAVKESCYQPPVEAISPTGPEAPRDYTDDLKQEKDDLLMKIAKVDREIMVAESQIAKLKKKYREQEETAKQPMSDSNEEEEKPKNQSIAQVIYAENRRKAQSSHSMLDKYSLDKYAVNELPLYNQPSDTDLYHKNKTNHAVFKKVLIDHFRKKAEEKDARERYLTDTYVKLSTAWNKRVERAENNRKRKERDAKSRELYEKIFPELRKQREDKERDHRLGTRGAVRSEADIEDVIERLQEQEMEDKKMHSLAVIPPLLLPPEERKRKFINNNGLILDPLKEYNERKFFNTWTEGEKEIFKEKFLLHPKNFGMIAQSLERKTVADCVQYYYLSKKTENYKQLLRKSKMGRRGRRTQPGDSKHRANQLAEARDAAQEAIIGATSSGVLTRNRNKNENENSRDGFDGSNRSTPQPNIKQEPTDDKDDDDKKGKSKKHDSSDDDEAQQSVKSGPHQCNVCKNTVDSSRAVSNKNLAFLLGLSESDVGSETRVCNPCFMKAQRKKGNSHCPIPVCTSTKGRVKGRLRHMPNKLKDLPKDARDAINNEFHITDNMKFRKVCTACFTRLNRRIAQLTDGNSTGTGNTKTEPENTSTTWLEDEIETLKNCLKNSGRNWALISQKLNETKTPEQCKKFFYNNRKKQQLDKLVTEYKRSIQIGDQPPTLSSDEESGSSTSSCEESRDLQNNATPSASGSNSPVPKGGSKDGAAASSNSNTNNSNVIKKEEMVKTELKSEPMDTSVSGGTSSVSNSTMPPSAVPKKEEEYDSSATMSADERESEPRGGGPTTVYMQQQPYLPPGIARDPSTSIRPLPQGYPGNPARPGERGQTTTRLPVPPHCGPMGPNRPPMAAPLPPSGVGANSGPQVVLPEGMSKDTITVKELMINVIEKSLSNPNQAGGSQVAQPGAGAAGVGPVGGGHPSHSSTQPPPSPTIQNLLDGSSKPGNKMTNYVREGVGLNPRVGTMAPPRAPPPQQQPQQQQGQSNDCETLDLSMPRRRESAATPPTFQRDMPLPSHRKSPSFASMSSAAAAAAAADVRPPPAHSNKVKTEPYLRDISPSSYEQHGGRPLTTPPHGMPGGTSPSPGPPRPPSSSSSRGGGGSIMPTPTTQAYMGRNPLPQPSISRSQPALSPKISSSGKPPLTIQTGSITQGTPVQQGAQQRYGEPLLKMTPPDARVGGGSITQGTPVYDKTARRIQESAYYAQAQQAAQQAAGAQRNAAAAVLAAAAAGAAGGFADPRLQAPDQHLTSRQVIMNDFAMARSNEMQRRPDSRDAHHSAVGRSASPATASRGQSLRDLSPRPRAMDSRAAAVAAQLTREAAAAQQGRGGPTSSDPRLDPRYIAAASQALAAEQQHQRDSRNNPGLISGLPEPRGDPKADIPNLHKSDPRAGLQRAQPASTLSRSGFFLGASTTASAMPNQQNRIAQDLTLENVEGPIYKDQDLFGCRYCDHVAETRLDMMIHIQTHFSFQTILDYCTKQVFLTSDGRYAAAGPGRSRSPPRSTPPPTRPMISHPAISQMNAPPQLRQGGITSGKPIVSKAEIYRGPPEVTISKTSSPRGGGLGGYSEVANNPLASLVDVAVQQPKLDLKDLNQMRQQAAQQAAQQVALATMLGVNSQHPKASAASLVSPSAQAQLIQQVQAERTKQQFYLVNQAAAEAAAREGYASSAARITQPSTKQSPQVGGGGPGGGQTSGGSGSSRADAPAVIINERERAAVVQQQQQMASISKLGQFANAQSLIDHIINQSIGGSGTSSEDLAKATLAAKALQEQAHNNEAAAANAAAAAAAAAAVAARSRQQPPPSSASGSAHEQSSSSSHKPTLPPDMVLNRELSITPASSTSAEDYMKKRQILITTSATLTPTSTAPTTRPVSDERQITRVAQSVSPAVNKLNNPENPNNSASATVASIVSSIANNSTGSGNSTTTAASAGVALDLKPRSATDLVVQAAQQASMRPPVVTAASVMAASLSMAGVGPPNGDQPPPGMNPLEYVKNKIMAEMKKQGPELVNSSNPALLASVTGAITAGQKRASPEAASGAGTGNASEDVTSKKIAKVVDGPTSNAGGGPAHGGTTPDSPGSPGAMVIDERPEDGPTSSKSESKDSTGPGNSNDSAGGKATANPLTSKSNSSSATGSGSTASAPANTASNSSKYEPLSDDE